MLLIQWMTLASRFCLLLRASKTRIMHRVASQRAEHSNALEKKKCHVHAETEPSLPLVQILINSRETTKATPR